MTLATLTTFLGWACVINIVILIISTVAVILFRESIIRIHAGLFMLDEKDLGRAYFQYLAQYKIAIIVLNITPYIALLIMTG